ncbi:MAG TPA: isochorismatase family protein [Xanthobacteraceae bacterium]|jgi:nicotinamidase-related amidase
MNPTAAKFCAALIAAAMVCATHPAAANDITTEWDSVKLPPKPELKPVTVEPKTTALLVLDLMRDNCGVRPRCLPIVPTVKKLIDQARAHDMMIVYNLTGASKPEDMVDASVMPKPGDFMIKNGRGGDKFIRSNLDAGLKEKGIKTVIITGTSAQGAVATTSNGATGRGYKAVVPVDGTASEDAFRELYGIYHLAGGGPAALTQNVTVTRSDLIKFGE